MKKLTIVLALVSLILLVVVPLGFGLTVRKSPAPKSLQSSKTQLSSQRQAVRIVVLTGQTVKQINPMIFGFNLEWIENGNFFWDVTRSNFNQCLVTQAQQLKPGSLRFPGGIFSDFYHWRNGIGPQNLRSAASPLQNGSFMAPNFFGTDELLDLAHQFGAEPFFTANVGTGDAQEAADWVTYSNQGDRAAKVKIWELGNELYLKSDPVHQSVTMPPDRYAQKVIEWSTAMKQADPSVKIAAIGGANTGLYQMVQYPNWNETVLSQCHNYIDYLAVHNAYYPIINQNVSDKRKMYQSVLGADRLIKQNLDTLNAQLSQYAPSAKIAITEWSPLFNWTPGNPLLYETRSVGSAIYTAAALKILLESDRVEIAHFFKFSGSDFMAFLECGHTYPPFYAFQFFSNNFGSTLLRTTVSGSPTYNTTETIGLVPPLQNVSVIETVASNDASGKIYLIVINKDLTNAVNVQIVLDGMRGQQFKGTKTTLSGASVEDQTGVLSTTNVSVIDSFLSQVPKHSVTKFILQKAATLSR